MMLSRRATLASVLCTPTIIRAARAQAPEIVLGAAIPMTGALASSGVQYYNSLRLAQDDLNAAGGIEGRKLRIVFEDTQASNSFAVNAFIRLAKQPEIPFVFLSSLSTQILAMEPEILKAQVPGMTGGGANAIQDRHNPWIFRLKAPDSVAGAAVVSAVKELLKASRPGLLYTQDDYGAGAAAFAETALAAAGVPIVAKEAFAPRDNDFSAQLLSIKGKGADVLIGFTYNRDGALILTQRHRLGIDLPFVGGTAIPAPSTLALVQPDDLTDVYGFTDAVLGTPVSPASVDFVKRYTEKFGFPPDPYGGAYYDGAMIVADGIRKVGPDRTKLREFIAALKGYKGVTRTFGNDPDNNLARTMTLVRFLPGTKTYEPVATFPNGQT